ncbi:hypothetical protein [Sphingobacterium sp. SYP-B4668]|uniref:hypothetical protein n=1 Tax=Sphingobacterium sp. SYP-B4668 TaxID=2996035 RepID=UPI0022DE3A59|nr:hypothetical protein [Sphingobacterium sp. SYP-B4668]
MINSKIYKWNPIGNIPNQLYLNLVRNENNNLIILLNMADSESTLSIVFDKVIFYKSVIETCSLGRLDNYPILSTEWPLFKDEQSEYIEDLIAQSYQIYTREDLNHYIITHGDGIIDVVCFSQPLVRWEE